MIFDNPDYGYDDNDSADCLHCKWAGKIRDTERRYVNSPQEDWMLLAGREGWEYFCPRCGFIAASYYLRVS